MFHGLDGIVVIAIIISWFIIGLIIRRRNLEPRSIKTISEAPMRFQQQHTTTTSNCPLHNHLQSETRVLCPFLPNGQYLKQETTKKEHELNQEYEGCQETTR